ncbi:MAG: esterase [Candidatus Acidiferrales bacterium]
MRARATSGARFVSCAAMAEFLLLVFLYAPGARDSAQQAPAQVQSPEIGADGRVTFRLRDPGAKQVSLVLEGEKQPLPMQKDEQEIWSVTTGPLEPDFYGYHFVADGASLADPGNSLLKPNLNFTESVVHVPGPASLPWEASDVPHGAVHHHFYHSRVVGDDRDFYVYTPPGYDPRGRELYPVLYLLHGYSDDASAWTAMGRANVILDNLIAQGKARPMIVVMPLGYGVPPIADPDRPSFSAPSHGNTEKFRDALFEEVIPAVEKEYRARSGRDSRAIAGLSMGGAESLFVGLNALDRFAWIGAFSSGLEGEDFDKRFPALDSKANSELRLLWVACGEDDHLLDSNQKLRDWLEAKGLRLTWVETPGAHAWMVWRRNLANFAPLLFQPK